MKKSISTIFLLVSMFFAGGAIMAQSCTSVTGIPRTLMQNAINWAQGEGCTVAQFYTFHPADRCDQFVSKHRHLVSAQRQKWLDKINSPQWATIGPRNLALGVRETGRIVSTTGRMFIMRVPSIHNSLSLRINETAGKGKTSVVVCTMDANFNINNVATRWFNKNSSAKNNKSESRTINIPNAYGKLVLVHFDGKSVGNTFSYNIKIDD